MHSLNIRSKHLLDLPEDILHEILRNLDYHALVRCRLLCKFVHHIIQTHSEFQYVIELEKGGMMDRDASGLPHSERLTRLRSQREAWHKLTWKHETIVPVYGDCDAYELVSGVFAKTSSQGDFYVATLPSSTDPGHESHTDLGMRPRDFAIDPTQDLSFVLEADETPFSRSEGRQVRIHVWKLGTKMPHPEARSPVLPFEVYPHSEWGNQLVCVSLQPAGDVVGAVVSRGPEIRILIFNWKRGDLLSDSHVYGLPESAYDFSFISPRAFIVTTTAGSGTIQVYAFKDTPATPCLAITLHFPALRQFSALHQANAHSEALCGGTSDRSPFGTAMESRLHVITLQYTTGAMFFHSVYLLFTHNRTFLDYVSAVESGTMLAGSDIKWEDWGPEKSRFCSSQVPYTWARYVQGQQVICPPFDEDGTQCIRILDFNVPDKPEVDNPVPSADDNSGVVQELHSSPEIIPASNVFMQDVITQLPYCATARLLSLDEEKDQAYMIDQERVVGLQVDIVSNGRRIRGLHVLSFS
ncbi:hypothetical protein BDQ12DRAFT_723206 [Crucibulum laeve]|uniref:F-box domain-containing protein n=1 Tax=Crucibulum laeve TaxID=68775 RepID=A0A5C3M0Q0_9AGAR|nr:hypothetical protein BDQ12DRAFT_723206 [Crucibulum laeve]